MPAAWRTKTNRILKLSFAPRFGFLFGPLFVFLLAALFSQSIAFTSHQAVHIAQNLHARANAAAAAPTLAAGDHPLTDESCAICAAFRTPGQARSATTVLPAYFDVVRLEGETISTKRPPQRRLRPPSRAPPRRAAATLAA